LRELARVADGVGRFAALDRPEAVHCEEWRRGLRQQIDILHAGACGIGQDTLEQAASDASPACRIRHDEGAQQGSGTVTFEGTGGDQGVSLDSDRESFEVQQGVIDGQGRTAQQAFDRGPVGSLRTPVSQLRVFACCAANRTISLQVCQYLGQQTGELGVLVQRKVIEQ
jgi:hypothetical protein